MTIAGGLLIEPANIHTPRFLSHKISETGLEVCRRFAYTRLIFQQSSVAT